MKMRVNQTVSIDLAEVASAQKSNIAFWFKVFKKNLCVLVVVCDFKDKDRSKVNDVLFGCFFNRPFVLTLMMAYTVYLRTLLIANS